MVDVQDVHKHKGELNPRDFIEIVENHVIVVIKLQKHLNVL